MLRDRQFVLTLPSLPTARDFVTEFSAATAVDWMTLRPCSEVRQRFQVSAPEGPGPLTAASAD